MEVNGRWKAKNVRSILSMRGLGRGGGGGGGYQETRNASSSANSIKHNEKGDS